MATELPRIRATTILAVRRNGKVAIGGDGQVTVGETVMKSHAQKVRVIRGGKIVAGFAGAAADAGHLQAVGHAGGAHGADDEGCRDRAVLP